MYSTMTRSKKLAPVLRLMEKKEKSAALVMAQARRKLQYYEEKLEELRCYRDDYNQSMRSGQLHTMSANQLREYQAFMHQLSDGINLLAEKVEGQKQIKKRDEKLWISAKQNTDVLDKLIVKIKWMERKFANNLEAIEIDEQTSQKHKSQL